MHKKIMLAILVVCTIPYVTNADDSTWIIEVERDPQEVKYYIETYYPLVKVEYVYDTLLQALAVTGDLKQIEKLHQEQFVKTVNETQTYSVPNEIRSEQMNLKDIHYHPEELSYTGNGVKIGVIDTGIDYNHPDLKNNYKGGFDVVDFDDDPMETTVEQGMPTVHGTHVAGIVASNGKMRGVAPDADIYAYRALGPGGSGTTAQVMAALEQAVKDGMDVINMSLGSTVNSPDDPMTKAVDKAIELGTIVVVANGNSGPDRWTVGSPATSNEAISVGASLKEKSIPYFLIHDIEMEIREIPFSQPWKLEKSYPLEVPNSLDEIEKTIHDRIILLKRGSEQYRHIIKTLEEKGTTALIIYSNPEDDPNEWEWVEAPFPVVYVTEEEAELIKNDDQWIETSYKTKTDEVAVFSSRGPVTSTWEIKPDILAPGVDIMSTVPDGYASLQGTSMAAPYITGVLALLKEAYPDASIEELKSRLLSTTSLFVEKSEDHILPPSMQGSGHVDINKAVDTKYMISNNRLNFGKIDENVRSVKQSFTVTNVDDHPLQVRFNHPKRQTGISWIIPLQDTILPNEQKTYEVEAIVQKNMLTEGLHEGFLNLELNGEPFHLAYLMMNETSDYPRIAGFEMEMQPFQNEQLKLRLYVPEKLDELTINLYDQNNIHVLEILSKNDISEGYLEEVLQLDEIPSGQFQAVISAVQGDEPYTDIKEIYFP